MRRGLRKIRRGFTLIELMLVVAIIGLLAAIAIPKFANLVVKAKEASVRGKLGTLRSAISIYYSDNEGIYPDGDVGHDMTCLTQGGKYLDAVPSVSIPTAEMHGESSNIGAGGVSDGTFMAGSNGWKSPFISGIRSGSNVWVNCTHTDTAGRAWSLY